MTTTMTLYNRIATVVADRVSFNVMSVLDAGNPAVDPAIDIVGYRQALDWLLDYYSAGIPAPSSIAQLFWDGYTEFNSSYSESSVYTTFQSILTFPIWLSNANSFGNIDLAANQIDPSLPKEFYTMASVSTPYTKITIGQGIFWAFVALETVVHSFIWLVLLWICFTEPHPPCLSSYPLIDFALKTRHNFQTRELHPGENSNGVLCADDRTTLARLCQADSITCATRIVFSDSLSTAVVAAPAEARCQAMEEAVGTLPATEGSMAVSCTKQMSAGVKFSLATRRASDAANQTTTSREPGQAIGVVDHNDLQDESPVDQASF
jgi:hypothetical protein